MTLYALILFSHIFSAFFLFGGLALEWLCLNYLRKSSDRLQADSWIHWIHLARTAPRFYGPALGVVLFSGGYLASKIGGNQGWILVSMVTLLLVGLIGAVVTGPRVRGIWKIAKEPAGRTSSPLQNSLNDPVLLTSVRLRSALVFGVLFLMVSKVDLRPSLVAIGCAAVLGLVIAIPAWRRAAVHGAKASS